MTDRPLLRASGTILTLSNSISFFRALLSIPTVLTFLGGQYTVTCILMAVAYLSDIADGYVARKTNTISEFGKAIDPIADKIFVISLVLAMVTRELIPGFLVAIIIAKDVLTMIGAVLVRKQFAAIPPSNYWGKSAILVTIIFLFLAVAGVSGQVLVFGWFLAASLLIVSFMIYIARAWALLRRT
ncbi:MAG: CDP-alcohol phosphatidyltransferase family protein [Bacteroidetes bacterium]|nr:CDP-alcohol phosphatidyltransferase family protein [Bacteroidota bacterium]